MTKDREMNRVVAGIILVIILVAVPVSADTISPAITHVYFEKDGVPYNGSVQYSVNCYGYTLSGSHTTKPPGSYEPELAFHYSATCREYGCSVYPVYYLQYTHIDWCNVEGTTDDGPFIIRNFSSSPYTSCESVPRRTWRMLIENDDEDYLHYYYATPEYDACKNQNYSSSHPGQNHSVERLVFSSCREVTDETCFSLFQGYNAVKVSDRRYYRFVNTTRDVMDEPRFRQYLEFCDPLSDSECGGWILDGRPVKEYPFLFPFRNNATHLLQYPCDRFLIGTNASLGIPESDRSKRQCTNSCSVADQVCDTYFTIPERKMDGAAIAEQVGKPVKPRPWYGETQDYAVIPTSLPAAGTSSLPASIQPAVTIVPPPVHRSPVESLYCSILELLGGRCK